MDQTKSGRFIAEKRKEKEALKRKSRKNLFSCVMAIVSAAVLFSLMSLPVSFRHKWVYFWDPLTLIMDPVLVLIMLLATGNAKPFFQAFRLIRKKDIDRNQLFLSLQAVRLAIASFLLGGRLLTIFDMIFVLGTMTDEPGKGIAVTLLTTLYGMLSALLLLPFKYRLESKMEEIHEKSDQS